MQIVQFYANVVNLTLKYDRMRLMRLISQATVFWPKIFIFIRLLDNIVPTSSGTQRHALALFSPEIRKFSVCYCDMMPPQTEPRQDSSTSSSLSLFSWLKVTKLSLPDVSNSNWPSLSWVTCCTKWKLDFSFTLLHSFFSCLILIQ